MKKGFVLVIAALLIGGGGFAVSMMAQPSEQVTANAAVETAAPSVEKTDAGFLNYDIIIGDKNAPIEIIEYAAISCPHCAHFHEDIYPLLKKKYLDTGKAKLVYRNFIFDNPFDVFAASQTRCVSEAKFLPTLEAYFNSQQVWNNIPELRRLLKEEGRDAALRFAQAEVAKIGVLAGISGDRAQACYDNDAVIGYLIKVREDAVAKYKVNSTPTIIVNGKKLEGNDMAAIESAIAAAE